MCNFLKLSFPIFCVCELNSRNLDPPNPTITTNTTTRGFVAKFSIYHFLFMPRVFAAQSHLLKFDTQFFAQFFLPKICY